MINRAVLTGRLTRDPELKYTQGGNAVCSFTLAVDRQFRNQDGDRDSDFINCVIWRKSAENFANFTQKGSLIGIDGRIQTRNYENQQGQRVYVTEVVVDNFAFLDSRQKGSSPQQSSYNQNASQGRQGVPNQGQGNYPQNSSNGYQGQAGGSQGMAEISEDELPF